MSKQEQDSVAAVLEGNILDSQLYEHIQVVREVIARAELYVVKQVEVNKNAAEANS